MSFGDVIYCPSDSSSFNSKDYYYVGFNQEIQIYTTLSYSVLISYHLLNTLYLDCCLG